jgi:hypothetical protein
VGRHPQPRRIIFGGREAVALSVEEYEALIASRRQVGGQSARVRILGQRVKQAEQLLRALETLIAAPPHRCSERHGSEQHGFEQHGSGAEDDPDGDCLRCDVAALLRSHRETAT